MLVSWLLGACMGNTATALMMLPIALAIISMINDVEKYNRFVMCLLLSIAYVASIEGVTTMR